MDNTQSNKCVTCGQMFVPGEYRPRRKQCRACGNRQWRESYERNKGKWASKSKERINAYHRKRRADPETNKKILLDVAKYRERHKIKCLARAAKARARKGGIDCDAVFLDELGKGRPENCECCGRTFDYKAPPIRPGRPGRSMPSLDRIDPTKGYVRGNVGIICWRCNAIKRDGTLEELEAIVRYMKERLR